MIFDNNMNLQEDFLNLGKAGKSVEKGITKSINKSMDGLMKGLKQIMKILKKIEKWFNKFGDMVKHYAKALAFMANPRNAIAIILTLTVPVIGQLVARFMLFNGSMDKLWLFLFAIPPLTIVPAGYMIFDMINSINGGSPWDNLIWLPIIANTVGILLTKQFTIFHIVKMILTIGGFYFAYWAKSQKICTAEGSAKNSKLILDSLISYMFIIILSFALPHLPFIGNLFSILQAFLPYSEIFFQAFAIFLVYVGTNITNGTYDQLCKLEIQENELMKVILTTVVLVAISTFSPGDPTSLLLSIKTSLSQIR